MKHLEFEDIHNSWLYLQRHIKELHSKMITEIKTVWGIGQIRFRDDFQIRTLLFDSIIRKSLILYVADVWDGGNSCLLKSVKIRTLNGPWDWIEIQRTTW